MTEVAIGCFAEVGEALAKAAPVNAAALVLRAMLPAFCKPLFKPMVTP
jgi:hypothetical protein